MHILFTEARLRPKHLNTAAGSSYKGSVGKLSGDEESARTIRHPGLHEGPTREKIGRSEALRFTKLRKVKIDRRFVSLAANCRSLAPPTITKGSARRAGCRPQR